MKVEDGVAYLSGDLTLENSARLLGDGIKLLGEGVAAFDLAGLDRVDSSALSALLGWRRAAAGEGRSVRFLNLPASLLGLAKLYGVAELIDAS